MSSTSNHSSELAFLDVSDEEADEEQMLLTCAIVGKYPCSKTIILC
jgi:hypothetical protein